MTDSQFTWKHTEAVMTFCSFLFFSIGLMLIDYGATMRISGGHGETLLFSSVPPRVTYHSGILLAIVAMFFVATVAVSELLTYVDDS